MARRFSAARRAARFATGRVAKLRTNVSRMTATGFSAARQEAARATGCAALTGGCVAAIYAAHPIASAVTTATGIVSAALPTSASMESAARTVSTCIPRSRSLHWARRSGQRCLCWNTQTSLTQCFGAGRETQPAISSWLCRRMALLGINFASRLQIRQVSTAPPAADSAHAQTTRRRRPAWRGRAALSCESNTTAQTRGLARLCLNSALQSYGSRGRPSLSFKRRRRVDALT